MANKKEVKKVASISEGTEHILLLDPISVRADDNSRFGLKKIRIESLRDDIIAKGRVLEPIGVQELTEDPDGFKYKVVYGHYRHAAVIAANEQGAGLPVPATIVEAQEVADRLKMQVAENVEREEPTPMDIAVAAKKLLDAGVPKMEVRGIFKRPAAGKGYKPCSNAWLNIILGFLDLPKKIQNKIHNGEIGVADGYEISRARVVAISKGKEPDEAVNRLVERAEAATQNLIVQDEEDETKLLEAEKKSQAEEDKKKEAEAKVVEARAKVESALAELKAKATEAKDAYPAEIADKDAKLKAFEAFRAKEKEAMEAEKAVGAARKELDKLEGKSKTAAQTARERADQLRKAREDAESKDKKGKAGSGKTAGKTVAPGTLKKAAKEEGLEEKVTPLNIGEIRKFVSDLCLPGGDAKVIELGRILKAHFAGESTEREAYNGMEELLGVAPKKNKKVA
jgi:ParB/RepB/Spo0J family partition protein